MKAILLTRRGPDGAVFQETKRPVRSSGEVLVRMLAASLNRVDLYMRDNGAGITHELPQVMGVDGVGEVVEAPEGSDLSPDDRVILYPYEFCGTCPYCLAGNQPLCLTAKIPGEHRDGTFAEYIALPEASVLPLSADTDPLAAATVGVAYLTAWRMVFGKAPLEPGMSVLVQGAGGGVAYAAAQLARMAGARVIVTTSVSKLAHFREIGFEAIDYKSPVAREVLSLTGGHGVDHVIDNVGAATWDQSLRSVRRGGNVVTCGATTGSNPSADLQRLFIRQISVHGSTMGSLTEFRHLIDCFERGLIDAPVDRVFDLSDGAEALHYLAAPERIGKVVLKIAEPGATDK